MAIWNDILDGIRGQGPGHRAGARALRLVTGRAARDAAWDGLRGQGPSLSGMAKGRPVKASGLPRSGVKPGPRGAPARGPARTAAVTGGQYGSWATPQAAPQDQPEPQRPDYDALFRASIDRQRQAIDAQLRQSMTDIGARRSQGEKIVNMLPSEVNAIYDAAAPAIDKQTAAASADLQAAGASAPGQAQMAGVDAIKGAIEASRAAGLGDQPYLAIGNNEMFNRQSGQANMIASQMRGDLDSQMTGYYGERAMQDDSGDRDFQRQLYLRGLDKQDAADSAAAEGRTLMAGTRQGSPRWWQAYSAYDPGGANSFAENYNLNPATLERWQSDPKAWTQAKTVLAPQLVAFLRFQHGLQ